MHDLLYYNTKLREISLWRWLKNNSIVYYDGKEYRIPKFELEIVMNVFRNFSSRKSFKEGHDVITVAIILMIVTKFWEDIYYFTATDISKMVGVYVSDIIKLEYLILKSICSKTLQGLI